MQQPKICHMTSAHERYDSRIFQRECKYLAEMGYDVFLVVNDEEKNEKFHGVNIVSTGRKYKSRKDRMLKGVKYVYLEAMKLNADIYHLHDPELLRVAIALKKHRKKVVFDSHENYRQQIKEKPYLPKLLSKMISSIYGFFETYIVKHIDGVVVPCPMVKGKRKLFEGSAKHVAYVNNVPCLDEIEFGRTMGEKERAVCYSGSLTEGRGVTNVVKAASLADVKLYLAGSFISEEYGEKLRSMPEWKCVEYLGYIDRKEIYEMYSRSRIGMSTLLPVGQYDKTSNLSTKAYEYMGCGLPVILSDFPYNRRMIEKYQFGEVVDPCNIDEMAEKIRQLIDDQDKCREMGERGEALVRNKLNFDIEGKNMIQLYNDILGNP